MAAQVDHADELLRLVATKLPGFRFNADGKAHPLPSTTTFSGHGAATQDAIAVAFGSNSGRVAVDVLNDKPTPAPLAVMAIDYPKFGALGLPNMPAAQREFVGDMFNAFGMATMQILIDERGLVFWAEVEQR
jgi:hypothetical protein